MPAELGLARHQHQLSPPFSGVASGVTSGAGASCTSGSTTGASVSGAAAGGASFWRARRGPRPRPPAPAGALPTAPLARNVADPLAVLSAASALTRGTEPFGGRATSP